MSNTTPEPPEDRPAHESDLRPAAEPDADPFAEPVAEPFAEPTEATSEPTGAGSELSADDDLDGEPGDVSATPVASSSHVSGTSDTGQTQTYDAITDEPTTVRPVEQPTTEYRPATDQQPVTPGYTAQPMYVTAPDRPKPRGNRGAGILIALLAAVVYAVVSAIVVLVIFMITKRTTDVAMHDFVQYIGTASYYIPIIFFALAFILLVAIVNRGGWWAYILGAFFVGVIVYFAYVGGVLLTIQAWNFSPGEVARILSQLWANPLTIGAAIVAREVPIWFGAWIAARGRKVRERNDDAQRDYEKALADGPQPIQRTA